MKRLRFRIRNLMIWVAVAALNLGVTRALLASRHLDLLLGGTMTSFMLQIGVCRFLRSGGRRRSYWLGFVGGGSIATISVVAALFFKRSVLWGIWSGYSYAVGGLLERLQLMYIRAFGYDAILELGLVIVRALALLLPLLVAACAAGSLAFRIGETRRPMSDQTSQWTEP
jgi:hypothetical protein